MKPISIAQFLSPVIPDEFFANVHNKTHLHVPAHTEKQLLADGILDMPHIAKIASLGGIWDFHTLHLMLDRIPIKAQDYCQLGLGRDGQEKWLPDQQKISEFLEKKASLILDDMDGFVPEVSALAKCLEDTFDAIVQGNLYFSWKQRQAFESHFDSHDVFALQLHGVKTWNIYETQENFPINHAIFKSRTDEDHRRARGKIIDQVKLQPGDILYIPRGRYHDALCDTETTSHIAFGVNPMLGIDFFDAIRDTAINDSLFRQALPRHDLGAKTMRKHLQSLGQSFMRLANDERVLDQLRMRQRARRMPRGHVGIAATNATIENVPPRYIVKDGFAIIRRAQASFLVYGPSKKGQEIPKHLVERTKWIVDNKEFYATDFQSAFADITHKELLETLHQLQSMGVLI